MKLIVPSTLCITALLALASCGGAHTLTIQSRTARAQRSAAFTNITSLAIYIEDSDLRADTIPSVVRMKVGSSIQLRAEAIDSDGNVLPANPIWRPQLINKLNVSPNVGPNVTLTALEAIDSTYVEVTQAGIHATFSVNISK